MRGCLEGWANASMEGEGSVSAESVMEATAAESFMVIGCHGWAAVVGESMLVSQDGRRMRRGTGRLQLWLPYDAT